MSVLAQVTVSPTSIVTGFGMKHESVSSQPGVEEPAAFYTVTSANAWGTAKSPIAKTTKSEEIMICFVLIKVN